MRHELQYTSQLSLPVEKKSSIHKETQILGIYTYGQKVPTKLATLRHPTRAPFSVV